jgi:hypothetical protein
MVTVIVAESVVSGCGRQSTGGGVFINLTGERVEPVSIRVRIGADFKLAMLSFRFHDIGAINGPAFIRLDPLVFAPAILDFVDRCYRAIGNRELVGFLYVIAIVVMPVIAIVIVIIVAIGAFVTVVIVVIVAIMAFMLVVTIARTGFKAVIVIIAAKKIPEAHWFLLKKLRF